MHNALDWFEIPLQDLDRAQAFYEALLGTPLRREALGPRTLAVLPYAEGTVGGAEVVQPRVDLPDGMGAFVHVLDSEGNRIGLHAAG